MTRYLIQVARKFVRGRTARLLYVDLLRARARLRMGRRRPAACRKLHLGCGARKVQGWLNVDVRNSDFDVDLASGALPWADGTFESVVSQHFIQDLELEHELLPLLKELKRVMTPGGDLWLTTADLEKLCRGYLQDRCATLIQDRKQRNQRYGLNGFPTSHFVNHLVYDDGWNLNLFDFELLQHVLDQAGFSACQRVAEADLLRRFPEFPPRHDDLQTLCVRAEA